MGNEVRYSIDRFIVFMGVVQLAGWIFGTEARVENLVLVLRDGEELPFSGVRLPADDVVSAYDERARGSRFAERWLSESSPDDIVHATLVAVFSDGTRFVVERLGTHGLGHDPSHEAVAAFFKRLNAAEPGRFLEVGSRARSGITRRGLIPKTWDYVGLDVMAGENVDVVGDAHKLSQLFEARSFRGLMALSVLEHIMMPWKFAIEANRVMEHDAVGLISTHQTFPLHDQPWDFWRFSSHAWDAIFNKATGFRILAAEMGEPAFIVANRCHAVTNFGDVQGGFLSSVVVFQKISETTLSWDVEVRDITQTSYPEGTSALPT